MSKGDVPLDNVHLDGIVAAYRGGMTTEEIGVSLGVTGQCIRLRLAKAGITANELRREKKISKSAALQASRVAAREKRCQRQFGCDWQTFKSITGGSELKRTASPLARSYHRIKWNCQKFGVGFFLTLPEYQKIVGPHIGDIGRGKLVVARRDKKAPYVVTNTELRSHSDNSRLTNGFRNGHLIQSARKAERKAKVVELAARGLSRRQIAKRLGFSLFTVHAYLYEEKNQP